MTELHDRLDRLAGPAVPPTEAQADADLLRARRALRHRRTAQKVAGSAFAVAALVAGGGYVASAPRPSAPTPWVKAAEKVRTARLAGGAALLVLGRSVRRSTEPGAPAR